MKYDIKIDLARDALLTEQADHMLRKVYMRPNEKSPQEAFARAATTFATDKKHAQRLYDYASLGWFSFSTPMLCNGGTDKGLPISCFLNYVGDSRKQLCDHHTENVYISTGGGGISGYWGGVRSINSTTSSGNRSTGIIPFLHVQDAAIQAFKQGDVRRGTYSAYLDISHPEIQEFISMRKTTGGDINRKNTNLHHGVNIPDKFMRAVVEDLEWPLIDPNDKRIVKIVSARELFISIIETRAETGEPYIHFIDQSNLIHLPK